MSDLKEKELQNIPPVEDAGTGRQIRCYESCKAWEKGA